MLNAKWITEQKRPSVKTSVLHCNTSYTLVLYNDATNQTINYQLYTVHNTNGGDKKCMVHDRG